MCRKQNWQIQDDTQIVAGVFAGIIVKMLCEVICITLAVRYFSSLGLDLGLRPLSLGLGLGLEIWVLNPSLHVIIKLHVTAGYHRPWLWTSDEWWEIIIC